MRLPVFTKRRRDPVTCSNCGAKLERVLPGLAYYTLSFITAMLVEVAVVPVMFLFLARQWGWIAATITGALVINLAVSMFLNAHTRVEFVDPADARKDKPGRWYPE